MKFLVCKKQAGYGCDYTIGCGMVFEYEEAETIEKLIEAVLWPDGRNESSALEGEDALVELLVVPVEFVLDLNLPAFKREIKQMRIWETEKFIAAEELAELARLQAKYD